MADNHKPLSVWLMAVVLLSAQACLAADKPAYLPLMAPEVDPTAGSAAAAPSVSASDVPAAGAAEHFGGGGEAKGKDQTNSLLKQALEKHNTGDIVGAEKLFKQVLARDPGDADANFNLGAMAEERNDLLGAIHYYYAAAKAHPADKDIGNALASVREKLQKQESSEQLVEQLQQKEKLRHLGQDAAAAYKAGKFDRTIDDLALIEKERPLDPDVQFGLGQAYRAKGDNARALSYLSKAVSLAPNNPLYLAHLKDLQQASSSSGKQSAQEPPPASNSPGRKVADDPTGWVESDGNAQKAADNSGLMPFDDQGEGQLGPSAAASPYAGAGMGGYSPAEMYSSGGSYAPMGGYSSMGMYAPMGMGSMLGGMGMMGGSMMGGSMMGGSMMGSPYYSMGSPYYNMGAGMGSSNYYTMNRGWGGMHMGGMHGGRR